MKPDCCWILYQKQDIIPDYNNGRNRKPCAGGKISGKGAERDGGAQ